jgi:hypothetical protein
VLSTEVSLVKRKWLVAAVPGFLALLAGAVVLMLFIVKVLWAWTIPDLFPGAVQRGMVAGSISWLTALKIAVFLVVLAAISGARGKH